MHLLLEHPTVLGQTSTVTLSVTQILTTASILLTVLMLGLSLWKGLNRSRLRPTLDVLRIVIQSSVAVAIPLITGVTTEPAFIVGPAVGGLALGVLQGQRLLVEVDESQLYARRSKVGFLLWGAGLVLMQGAGLANRTGLVEIGQAVTWFSIGVSVGLVLGRTRAVKAALLAAPQRATAAVVVLLFVLGGCADAIEFDTVIEADGSNSFEIALGGEPDPEEPLDCTLEDAPANAYSYADSRGQGLEWCVVGFANSTLPELANTYVQLDEGAGLFTVDCLALVGDSAAYRVRMLIEENEGEIAAPWRVTVPGAITSSNADRVDGSTATWDLGQALGAVVFEINVGPDGDCPSGPLSLQLRSNADGSGTALLTAPTLATGPADTNAFIADLQAGGWAISQPSTTATQFTSERAWSSPAELDQILDSLPALEGSTVDVVPDPESGQIDFDATIDLSFYENYWQGINPALSDPPFSLVYLPAGAIELTSGAWTDSSNLTFDWTVASDGRIFSLFATSDPQAQPGEDAAADESGTDSADERGEVDRDESDGDSGGGDAQSPGLDTDDVTDPAELTEAEAAAILERVLDGQEVTENEALAAAVAGLIAAAGAGLLSLGEAALAARELAEAAAHERAAADAFREQQRVAEAEAQRVEQQQREAQAAAEAKARQHALDMHRQAEQELILAIGHGVPFNELSEEIDAIRERVLSGTATQADLDRLRAVRDEAHRASLDADAQRVQHHETSDQILAGFEWGAWGTTVAAGPAAAALGGPAAATIIGALVDGGGQLHLGLDKAAMTALSSAVLDRVTAGLLGDISKLGMADRVSQASIATGAQQSAQNYMSQLIANDGDASKIDMEQVRSAGYVGMGVGGFTQGMTPTAPGTPNVSNTSSQTFGSDRLGQGWGQRLPPDAGGSSD